MNEKISVIVPVYNSEKFLKRCTDSILNQTYKNIELILVNDGSKDNSLSLCREIAKSDSRVVVVDKPNGGAASARNTGLDYATGEYIGFCDSDDFLDLEMYEMMKNVIDKDNLDVVDANSKVFDENGNFLYADEDDVPFKLIQSNEYIRSIFRRTGNVHLGTKLFKSSLLSNLRIPEGRRVEDFYFTICFLLKTNQIGHISNPFYCYTINSNSVTRQATGSIYLDALYFYELAIKLLENYPYSMVAEKMYYKLKMYYLLSITITKEERKKYSEELRIYQNDIRRNLKEIGTNPYLKTKEKIVLYISGLSMRISRFLFNIKNGGIK